LGPLATEKVLPIQYELVNGNLSLTVQNQSSSSVILGNFYTYIFLDEFGLPIDAGLGALGDGSELLPGTEFTSQVEAIPEIVGSVSSVRFILGVSEIANLKNSISAYAENAQPSNTNFRHGDLPEGYLNRQSNQMIMYKAKQMGLR